MKAGRVAMSNTTYTRFYTCVYKIEFMYVRWIKGKLPLVFLVIPTTGYVPNGSRSDT